MGFNEKVHAYIAARYYTRMKEAFGDRGVAAYIHAVQYYAGQRGRRMAQRAIRDGKELTHATFMQYGELVVTDEVVAADGELVSLSPDYELHITNCPWHDQFKEMNHLEAGDVYCSYIDEALCRGFNPALVFQAPTNLNSSAYCNHRVVGTYYDQFPDDPAKNEYKKDFSYHCGNMYWSIGEVCSAIFGAEGEAVNVAVLSDFAKEYGQEMADELTGWRYTNFNVC